jgi:sortase A
MSKPNLFAGAGAFLIALGLWQGGEAAYIEAKAWLAQDLLDSAWSDTLGGAQQVKPWPWADTWPVALLTVPDLGVERIVLAGASGRTLAFGPAHLDGTAPAGATGHAVLTGHRDTHFRFLRDLTPGMALRVQRPDGTWRGYRVAATEVLDARSARLTAAAGGAHLTLVTCYPFDTIVPGGPLRYAVYARAADQ